MAGSFIKSFLNRIAAWHWGAPSDGDLIAWHDGELTELRMEKIRAHLAVCDRCRKRAARIAQDWNDFAAMSAGSNAKPVFEEEQMIADIRASIHAWSEVDGISPQAAASQALTQTEAERQAIAILGLYIGQRAARDLLHGIDTSEASRQAKLAQAESTLRVLLGHKGATAVVARLARIMNRISDPASHASTPCHHAQ